MSSLQANMASQEERLNEVDKEARAHSASSRMLKEKLNSRLVASKQWISIIILIMVYTL